MVGIYKVIYTVHCENTLRIEAIECINNDTFGGMQHCHSNLTLIKHYKIQAKFEFGGNSPIFD